MSSQNLFPEVANLLKRLLKDKGLTYRDLADKLNLSESAVKKLFIGEDCSLVRLHEICAIVGISVSDLLNGVEARSYKVHRHTPEQEAFLLENPKAFHVYCKLVFEELTPADIVRDFQITETALFKILRSLDQHELLELLPHGDVKLPDMGMTLWENAGPLIAKMKREWPGLLLDSIHANPEAPGTVLKIRTYHMTEATQDEYNRALDAVDLEFARRARREELLDKKNTHKVSTVFAMARRSFIEKI